MRAILLGPSIAHCNCLANDDKKKMEGGIAPPPQDAGHCTPHHINPDDSKGQESNREANQCGSQLKHARPLTD